ncbi:MAG: M1 family aminopeptidase, partial [Planctomycetota bacterium]
LEQSWDGIPITSWYYPGDIARAQVSFHDTPEMMEFFSKKFGRYPWNKYDQIVVREFVAGGMENTTATILTETTLHHEKDDLHASSQGLVAHELAHQWFGDLVTCRDWADLWINESFATFCSAYYAEHYQGRPDAQMSRRGYARSYFGEDGRYRRPISCKTYRSPDNMFDRHSYQKGARVLEMLRQMLGDETFTRAVRLFLDRHRLQSVEAYQFERALEDATGLELNWFFDQWIHHGGHPEIEVRQSYDADRRRLSLRVKQTQSVDELTHLFRLPVSVAIYYSGRDPIVREIVVTKKGETFSFDVPARPDFVRFDHRSVLLMKLDFEKPRAEWVAQLSRDEDTLGRVQAAEALGELLKKGDDEALGVLSERLFVEEFWGVREAIVDALGSAGGTKAAAALERALAEKRHPRVRESAARGLGNHRLKSSLAALEKAFDSDSSDWVRERSLRSYARIDRRAALALARRGLDRSAHRERIRRASIDVIVGEDDTLSLAKVLELAKPGSSRSIRSSALNALARLGKGQDKVRKAIESQLDDPHLRTRRSVISALRSLGDRASRDALLARKAKEPVESVRQAIDDAVEALGRPRTEDELRREIEELRRRDKELEKRVRELEESKGK